MISGRPSRAEYLTNPGRGKFQTLVYPEGGSLYLVKLIANALRVQRADCFPLYFHLVGRLIYSIFRFRDLNFMWVLTGKIYSGWELGL